MHGTTRVQREMSAQPDEGLPEHQTNGTDGSDKGSHVRAVHTPALQHARHHRIAEQHAPVGRESCAPSAGAAVVGATVVVGDAVIGDAVVGDSFVGGKVGASDLRLYK